MVRVMLFALVGTVAGAQVAGPGPVKEAPPTLRAEARLVVVDVVVADGHGAAVHGLQRGDLQVFEDGAGVEVKSFEEHRGGVAGQAVAAAPKLPPHVFTNRVAAGSEGAVNVILLDTLNTPLKDQSFVRSQLQDYLKNAPPGRNIAIFGLSTRLVMLQGLTADPELLRRAVERQAGRASPLLEDAVGGGGVQNTLADDLEDMGTMPAQVVASLREFEAEAKSLQLQLRAKNTLDGLSVLGRYLAGIPGRKNLIWFSGSFPINILPYEVKGGSPFSGEMSVEAEYRATMNLLATSQVAVYPVDARGLMTAPSFDAATPGKRGANQARFSKDLNQFSSDTADEHGTMLRMADDTGGKAFLNTNGLSRAVASAVEQGSNYYTLSYVPGAGARKGFRRIEVKSVRAGYALSYRHGYLPDDETTVGAARRSEETQPEDLRATLARGAPNATQIPFEARVLLESKGEENALAEGNVAAKGKEAGPFLKYAVQFAVDPHAITFETVADGSYKATLDFLTLVYGANGKVLNTQSNLVGAKLTPARYAALMKGGVDYLQRISVPAKGAYSLRLIVRDRLGDHLGTLELANGAAETR